MKRENYLSWDTYFMSVALLSSFRSKDKKTQSGACITNTQNKIVGVGYNGLPIGLNDDNEQFWHDENDENILHSKHSYVIHAEQNAIHNRISQDLTNATLYVTLFPCRECAKSICQVGIKKVVYLNKKPHHEEENKAVEIMFKHARVEHTTYRNLKCRDEEFIQKLSSLN